MKLLIAEDNPKLLKSLIHIFEEAHYLADGVDNGKRLWKKRRVNPMTDWCWTS